MTYTKRASQDTREILAYIDGKDKDLSSIIIRLVNERDALKAELKAIVNDLSFLQAARIRHGELGQRLSLIAANRLKASEASLKKAKEVIQNAHDELMGERFECPQCGHSEPTSDMDVMEIVLKPAMTALGISEKKRK